ncbi:MAG: branched-chain amino acid transport system substrate-binding protein [Frankiaceae bacterium]|jgi:ABC-type branched-subunit amino acid transport system substrate-binding protein|nr:branched-chain amino acid transport system substrate-binding protein [Frankiaceae bacterium]
MRRGHIRLAAGGSMLLLLAATACGGSSSGGASSGGSSAPGVTATTVTIGSTQPLTGPAAPGYSEISQASDAYFKYINENGGINGRTITYKYLDDGYDPTKTVAQTKKLITQDKVFAIFNALGTPTHEKVIEFLNQQKVPDLFVASGCQCWDDVSAHPETFGWQPDYVIEGKILGEYVKKNFAGKKIAYFYQDDDFGKDGVKGLDMEIPKSQVVARESYQTSNPDIASQVQKFQSAKADVIVSFSIPAFTALLKLNALKVKYDPTLAVSNVGSDPLTLSGLLEAFAKQGGSTVKGSDLIQGVITDGYIASPADPTNSWIKLFQTIHDKYIPKLPFDGNVLYGMAAGYTFAQALAAAGANPTRDSLVKAVEAGLDQGPGLVPFRFSTSSHAGFTGVQIGVIKGTAVKLTGSPATTDDGNGPITAFDGTQPEAPANGIPTSG